MPSSPIKLPALPKTPALPLDGIYFDMDFETYLAAPAVGSGLLYDALVEPYQAWARSWMNPNKEEKEGDHLLYGKAFHARLLEGREEYERRFYVEPDKRQFDELLTTDAHVSKAIEEFEETPLKGNKPVRVQQLLELWPEAPIWDEIRARAEREGEGRICIKYDWHVKFEASAAMVEQDPELLELVRDGYSEVSLFWHCPRTGLPKKARADRLQLGGIVDVKTFANMHEKTLAKAIPTAIANEKYPFQPSHYLEGAAVVRDLIRRAEADGLELPVFQSVEAFDQERTQWALQWSIHDEPDTWTWLFVQKGDAPVAIGWAYDTEGMLREQFDLYAADATDRWVECVEEFGAEPWIRQHGIIRDRDQTIPAYVLEI